jgi:hypothetical protein
MGYLITLLMVGGAAAIIIPFRLHHVPRVTLLPSVVLVVGAILFYSLTIEISDGTLKWGFGPGLIRKSVKLSEIKSVEPLRIRWINGWGIHWTRRGWLYNVAGWEAVHIRLRNGKQFCLGTDEPTKLTEAIRNSLLVIPPAGGQATEAK